MPQNISVLTTYVNDLGGTNSTILPAAQVYRSFDRWMQNLNDEIQEAMADYNFQGEQSTHDLIANQREYLWPTDFMKIKRMDVMLDGANWKQCREADPNQIGDNYANEAAITAKFNNSEPVIIYLENSFIILSGTISSVTAGIKLTYEKGIIGQTSAGVDISNFTSTTDVSNLPEFAQMGLVYGALIDFFTLETNNKLLQVFNTRLYGNAQGRPTDPSKIGGLLKQILNYYTSKSPDQLIEMGNVYQQIDFN